jgi:TonB family protein
MGASVEASGASLRVEVQMQIAHSDARVVAASAVTAAAVALVTIVVYQGHVKVASGGQTVNVAAGGRVEVKPGASPREVREVATAAPGEEGAGGQAASASAEEGRTIAPVELEAHRLKGNKQVMPDSYEQRAMQSAHEDRVIAAIKLCVDTTGAVSQVRILRSSGYPGYDQKIASEVSAWGFRPIEIDGKAVPVCTALSFIYSQK